MSKALRQQLKQLQRYQHSINPRDAWVRDNKAKLMAQINNTTSEETGRFSVFNLSDLMSVYMPRQMAAVARPALIFVIAIATTVGGWVAGVSASYDSLPGDTLYGVKLATEKTQVALATVAGDKETETQLHLEFAGRRSDEVKQVLGKDDPEAPQKAEAAIQQLKKSIESAKQTVQEVGETDVAKAVGLARDVSQKTVEISSNLKDAVSAASRQENNIAKEVVETKQIVTAANIETLKIVVEKTAQSPEKTSEALQKRVTDLVVDKIAVLTEETKSEAEALKNLSAATSTRSVVSSSTSPLVSTTTAPIIPIILNTTTLPLTNNSSTVREAVKNIATKVDQSTELVRDAKELAGQRNLIQALDKASEANRVTSEATQAVSDVKENVIKILNEQREQSTLPSPALPSASNTSTQATSTPSRIVTSTTTPQR